MQTKKLLFGEASTPADDLAEFLEVAGDWAFTTDKDGIIRFCRKSANVPDGIVPENLVGKHFGVFLPGDVKEKMLDFLSPLNLHKCLRCTTVFRDEFGGLSSLQALALWDDDGFHGCKIIISKLPLMAQIKDDLTLLSDPPAGQVEKQLELQERQQEIITTLAMTFSSNQDLDALVRLALKMTGEFLQVDRCLLFQHSPDVKQFSCLFEWHSRGVKSVMHRVQNIPYNEQDESYLRLTTRPYIAVNDTSAFRGEEYEIQREQGVRAFVDLPITVEGRFWGFLGTDHSQGPHVWTENEFHLLQTIAGIISAAMERRAMQQKLENAIVAAEQASQAKSDFLSRMSHEIRTPMNAIIGMQTIAQKTDDISKIRYCLDKIDGASQQLLGLINDILDMSKIEANKFELVDNEFNFEKMLGKVFNLVHGKIEEHHQHFSFDFQEVFTRNIICDELRLSQVLINLLSNAAKFTPEHGEISLKVRQIPRGDAATTLRVEVRDTGIGLSPEAQSRLFTSFEQADGSITRKFGGTGLGLAICKKIITLMGGDIWVESEAGIGSTFIFEINVKWGGEIQEDVPHMPLRHDLRILVVDDSEDVRLYFSNILSGFSLHCDTASSGLEALTMTQQNAVGGRPYDLIFLDWNMPGLNGSETARRIKEIMKDNIIVVMISVADWSEIEPEAGRIGITRFLSKPVLPSVLLNTIIELTDYSLVNQSVPHLASHYDWHEKIIMIAEDIEINREIIQGLLSETGICIEFATTGVEAVQMYTRNSEKYQLILMDIQMPDLDGLGATRQIRASSLPNAGNIPIIAMTANAFKEDVYECLGAGMNDHVAKPINLDELINKLAWYLDGAS